MKKKLFIGGLSILTAVCILAIGLFYGLGVLGENKPVDKSPDTDTAAMPSSLSSSDDFEPSTEKTAEIQVNEKNTDPNINILDPSVKIDKNYILGKMLNTVDYFDSAKGKYETINAEAGIPINYTYEVDLNSTGLFGYEINETDNTGICFERTYELGEEGFIELIGYGIGDGDAVYPLDGVWSFIRNRKPVSQQPQDPHERFYLEEDGTPYWEYTIGMDIARPCLMPQEMAFGYLSDYDNWEIFGEEKFLGYDCIKIKGQLKGNYSKKLNVVNFEMWIEKSTGILLNYTGYSPDGNVYDYIKTTEFELNCPIKFELPNAD